MYEKVNPSHPDKIADRIAGAIVDVAYTKDSNPKIAVEVLIGHGICHIITETSVSIDKNKVSSIVKRITRDNTIKVDYKEYPQDEILSSNQVNEIKCGDNGIFKGVPLTSEEIRLSDIARKIYKSFNTDGKYVISDSSNRIIICQSNAPNYTFHDYREKFGINIDCDVIENPLGEWEGGIYVDTGAVNRKLGSDMGNSATGGGLHGKDLSKADVSVNIYVWSLAQSYRSTVNAYCAIGDSFVSIEIDCNETRMYKKVSYKEIVDFARNYINSIGGFEKFAEWGLF